MTFTTSYNAHQALYESQLKTIKGIKFTLREIDILSCVIHNRGEKKIASILSISPRTISAHIYNIMNKTGCNNKDQIIDIIENSGKLVHIREYYLHLIIRSNFEKLLVKISFSINRIKLQCYCLKDEVLTIDSSLWQLIKYHCTMANVIVVELNSKEARNVSIPAFLAPLSFNENDYYKELLGRLDKIINNPEATAPIIKEFEEFYNNVGQAGNRGIDEQGNVIRLSESRFLKSYLFWISISTLILFGAYVSYTYRTKIIEVENIKQATEPTIIKSFEEFLLALQNEQFSANNINEEQVNRNHSLIKQVEKIFDYNTNKAIQNYFNNAVISSDYLTSYLYNIQAIASYYMYNKHDGIGAQKMLLHAKDLIEKYIHSRGGVASDFNQLEAAEILAELQIIKDLPQIYTRVIYSLGRTYIYTNKPEEGRKFFELAKYMGDKLNLFEGYLSNISGIIIIETIAAENDIKAGNKLSAKIKLETMIESCQELLTENRSYIADFKPQALEQKLIVPSKEPYNFLDCNTRIISCFTKLIEITENQSEVLQYITALSKILNSESQKDKKSANLNFSALDKVPPRKIAHLYNRLGHLLVALNKHQIDLSEIKTLLVKAVRFNISDNLSNLNFAERLFDQARSISRGSDFTKADAYDGLINVCRERLRIENQQLPELTKQQLIEKINQLIFKRDSINKELNRSNSL